MAWPQADIKPLTEPMVTEFIVRHHMMSQGHNKLWLGFVAYWLS